MAQDWFKHDFFAPEDAKLVALQRARGYDGIGIYWTLMAIIGREPERAWRKERLPDLAFMLRLSEEQLSNDVSIMVTLRLLTEHEGWLYSHGMQVRMFELDARRDKLSRAGKKGMRNRYSGAKLRKTKDLGAANHVITPGQQPYNIRLELDKNRIELEEKKKGERVRAKNPKPPREAPHFEELLTELEKQNLEFMKNWRRWASARKPRLTQSIAETRLEDLRAWGIERATAALHHSVGYQGIFEPKNSNGNHNAKQTAAKFGGHDEESIARIYANNFTSATGEPPGNGH